MSYLKTQGLTCARTPCCVCAFSLSVVAGLTLIDFLALPPKARVSCTYQGEEGEGFLGLRKISRFLNALRKAAAVVEYCTLRDRTRFLTRTQLSFPSRQHAAVCVNGPPASHIVLWLLRRRAPILGSAVINTTVTAP
eukprot:1315178-Pleurochrysis_carterae.AAC.2